ncbi:hypothetical protein QBC34DRAFT_498496 [Podospora aff. communis PSN243]|uniref:Uncharacterized protein n=1 Tax=Podospora aff. communis PSN243 TaxID=3040156 RepID=A0AAV9G7Y1_9PEZI|nr:hypothetical protein QBC34DRAFT_498496 [Podospora aff. communis PSN243]
MTFTHLRYFFLAALCLFLVLAVGVLGWYWLKVRVLRPARTWETFHEAGESGSDETVDLHEYTNRDPEEGPVRPPFFFPDPLNDAIQPSTTVSDIGYPPHVFENRHHPFNEMGGFRDLPLNPCESGPPADAAETTETAVAAGQLAAPMRAPTAPPNLGDSGSESAQQTQAVASHTCVLCNRLFDSSGDLTQVPSSALSTVPEGLTY